MAKSQIQKLADKGAYSSSASEKLEWSYYDTVSLVSTTLVHRYFVNPIGSGGKTLADTNFTLAGQLPQGQNFTFHAIKVFYWADAQYATANILQFYQLLYETTVEIIITGKDSMGTWTLIELLGASTLTGLTPTVGGDNEPIILPSFKGIYPLNIPIQIGGTGSIELRMTHQVAPNAALDGDKVRLSLQGKLVRAS